MDYFPAFFDMLATPVLVVGGGEDALRKVRLMIRTKAIVYVHAEESPEWSEAVLGSVQLVSRSEIERLAADLAFAIIAEEDDACRIEWFNWAKGHRIPVNVVDHKGLSDFIVPSLIDQGKFTAAFTSGGAAPVLARDIRAELERRLPANLDGILEAASGARAAALIRYPDGRERRAFWQRLSALVMAQADAGPRDGVDMIKAAFDADHVPPRWEMREIELPRSLSTDDLTLGAYRDMQTCDFALIEDGVPGDFLNLLRRDAVRQTFDSPKALQELVAEHRQHSEAASLVVLKIPTQS